MDPRPGFMLFGSFITPGPVQRPEPPQLIQLNPSPASFPDFSFVENPHKQTPIPNACSSLPSSPASSVTNPINENPNSQHPRLSPERELRMLSPQLRRLLVSMGVAEDHNPTHFFTRSLFPSDVKKGLTRLTIPRNHLLAPFLTHQEEAFLQQRDDNNNLKRLQVDVVDPSLVMRVLSLSRWSYKKPDRGRKGGPRSWSYALNGGWIDLVNCNGLAAGDTIQVWSFRKIDASLGFIIFKEEKKSAVSYHVDDNPTNGNKEKGSNPTWGKKRKRGSSSSLSTMTTA